MTYMYVLDDCVYELSHNIITIQNSQASDTRVLSFICKYFGNLNVICISIKITHGHAHSSTCTFIFATKSPLCYSKIPQWAWQHRNEYWWQQSVNEFWVSLYQMLYRCWNLLHRRLSMFQRNTCVILLVALHWMYAYEGFYSIWWLHNVRPNGNVILT